MPGRETPNYSESYITLRQNWDVSAGNCGPPAHTLQQGFPLLDGMEFIRPRRRRSVGPSLCAVDWFFFHSYFAF